MHRGGWECIASSSRGSKIRSGQRVRGIALENDVVTLAGTQAEIRFPVRLSRKLCPLVEGPARNIVCNADLTRFNFQGVTKRE